MNAFRGMILLHRRQGLRLPALSRVRVASLTVSGTYLLQEIETLKARIQRLEDEKECLREVAKELESENNALEKKNTVLLEQLHSDHSTQDHQHYDSSDFEQLSSLMSSELQMDLGLVASLQLEGNQRRTSG